MTTLHCPTRNISSAHVTVPMETEPLTLDPTADTIRKMLETQVFRNTVINNWGPRSGKLDLRESRTSLSPSRRTTPTGPPEAITPTSFSASSSSGPSGAGVESA
ncbi:hypothetical protein [Rhodococcus sp. NPDC057529]|uniref:hypothetical protein n=1 Tax=Rhodococcus sp. NPDC057529 TaxID=3346158 RepID=UPI00366B5F19